MSLINVTTRHHFAKAGLIVHARFKQLENFCSGLATVFPGTANVESNFSILKWEKDDGRTALTNFSLEGIMHAKQYEQMSKLTVD